MMMEMGEETVSAQKDVGIINHLNSMKLFWQNWEEEFRRNKQIKEG